MLQEDLVIEQLLYNWNDEVVQDAPMMPPSGDSRWTEQISYPKLRGGTYRLSYFYKQTSA